MVGQLVELHNLKARADLNGRWGTVVGMAKSGRVVVRLSDEPNKCLSLKPENLLSNK